MIELKRTTVGVFGNYWEDVEGGLLERKYNREPSNERLSSAITVAQAVYEYDPASKRAIVALDDGVLVGFLTYNRRGEGIFVNDMAAFRSGAGIGTALMRDVEKVARYSGGVIYVSPIDDATGAFYSKLGYHDTGQKMWSVQENMWAKSVATRTKRRVATTKRGSRRSDTRSTPPAGMMRIGL